MFRVTIFLAACLAAQTVYAAPSPQANKELSINFDDSQENLPGSAYRLSEFSDLGSVLSIIKGQFKEIIEELAMKAFKYVPTILKKWKVNLLKKLAKFKVADMVDTVFDGVAEIFFDSVPVQAVYTVEEPVNQYDYLNYGLASLFSSREA